MKFVGPAQQPFNSFMDLAMSMLDTHCHNWNNLSDPRSYILPPVCPFKNSDKSDEDIEKIKIKAEQKKASSSPKSLNHIQRPVFDRRSDSGEFIVFYALWSLAQDNVQAPFLAIHGLNLANVRRYLQQIFPQAQVDIEKEFETMMREYDFVLIGPNIGLIVMEVKSSQFTNKKDLAENSRHLPDHITYALKDQLGSFDPTIFQVCSQSETAHKIPIRKVLFTPNLKKDRFETWLNNLDDPTRKQVMDKFDGVTHWFSEDMDNQCSHKPHLYTTLRDEIEKTGYQISQEIFESYGLIISGLSSAVVLQSQSLITISTEQFSTSSAILKDSAALASQNPKGQRHDEKTSNVVEVESKLVLLTPEQQNVLNGPNRQFIIGAPGTGKTIILQAKVAQLLKQGEKVGIFAQQPYDGKYEKLFGSHGSCKVHIVTNQLTYSQKTEEFFKRISDDGTLTIREILEKLSEHVLSASIVKEDLRNFDCIFIDDAFDWPRWGPDSKCRRIYESISLMAMANSGKFRLNFVWVACDAYLNDSDDENYKRMLNQIIRGKQGDYFSTSTLNRVMRSSESVFQATYSNEVIQHLAKEPVIGHKIHGFYDSVHLRNLSLDETLLDIWKRTYSAVRKFKDEGFDYGQMAILLGGEQFDLHRYLLDKFRDNGIPVGNNLTVWDSPGFLTLEAWRSVSSFEWPVVIYIEMCEAHEKRVSGAYDRYRACSRATMKLFEIIAHVEIDFESVDFYRGDDRLYVLRFNNRAQNQFNISTYRELSKVLALEQEGKLFESILGWSFTIYKFDLIEIPGVCNEILNLISSTNDEEQKYLERWKKDVPLTLDGLEYYCHRGHRLDLVEFIEKSENKNTS